MKLSREQELELLDHQILCPCGTMHDGLNDDEYCDDHKECYVCEGDGCLECHGEGWI